MGSDTTDQVVHPAAALAAHVGLAARIRNLLVLRPDVLMYLPGRPIWGICRMSSHDRVILWLDGCTQIVALLNPSFVRGMVFKAGTLARAIAAEIPLIAFDHGLLHTIEISGVKFGPCVLVDAEHLPWSHPASGMSAAPDQDIVIRASRIQMPDIPPVLTSPLLGGPVASSAEEFKRCIGAPPWIDHVPARVREARLSTWYVMAARHEKQRLIMIQLPIPSWLEDMTHA